MELSKLAEKSKDFLLVVENVRVRNSSGTPTILSEVSLHFLQYLQDSCRLMPAKLTCSVFFFKFMTRYRPASGCYISLS